MSKAMSKTCPKAIAAARTVGYAAATCESSRASHSDSFKELRRTTAVQPTACTSTAICTASQALCATGTDCKEGCCSKEQQH